MEGPWALGGSVPFDVDMSPFVLPLGGPLCHLPAFFSMQKRARDTATLSATGCSRTFERETKRTHTHTHTHTQQNKTHHTRYALAIGMPMGSQVSGMRLLFADSTAPVNGTVTVWLRRPRCCSVRATAVLLLARLHCAGALIDNSTHQHPPSSSPRGLYVRPEANALVKAARDEDAVFLHDAHIANDGLVACRGGGV